MEKERVIHANALPVPPLNIKIRLTDRYGRPRERLLQAELITFENILNPNQTPDVPEGLEPDQANAWINALVFLNQLTEESWGWLADVTGCETRAAGATWLLRNPVGTDALPAAIELAKELSEISYPDDPPAEKKSLLGGNLPGIIFWSTSCGGLGFLLGMSVDSLLGRLLQFMLN